MVSALASQANLLHKQKVGVQLQKVGVQLQKVGVQLQNIGVQFPVVAELFFPTSIFLLPFPSKLSINDFQPDRQTHTKVFVSREVAACSLWALLASSG